MKLSENLTLIEACRSETAKRKYIDNTPAGIAVDNLIVTAEKIFQPIRDHFKKPIYVSSMYRCERLNGIIGGTAHSKHITGEAIDIDNDGTDVCNKDIFNFIKDNLEFDVLIWELGDDTPNWVHCSYVKNLNRKLVFRNIIEDGLPKLIEYKEIKEKKYEPKQKEEKVQRDQAREVLAREVRSVPKPRRSNSR
tara:strand:- start:606 stop:1184 length:579 start_codon:yes stop_codon:yes gene_type:complete